LLQTARFADLFVEVFDDWDVKCSRAGFNPIFADLVAVTRVNWLDLVSEIIDESHHGLKIPAFASHAFPHLTVIFKWPEGNQGIVRGAASENFGSGVSDM
jgi:hypothetical protein